MRFFSIKYNSDLKHTKHKNHSQPAPDSWHLFLYRSILLFWEKNEKSGVTKTSFKNKISDVHLIKKKTLDDMKTAHELINSAPPDFEFIIFHSYESAHSDLFKSLRNCVAHGHYSNIAGKHISFNHEFNKKLKLIGKMKYSSLRKLILTISERTI